MATEKNVIDPISVGFNSTFNLVRKCTWPFHLKVGKKLLQFNGRRTPRRCQKLQASRPPIAVCDDIFLTHSVYKWGLENLSLKDYVFGKIAHVRLLRCKKLGDRCGFIFEFAVTIICWIYNQ